MTLFGYFLVACIASGTVRLSEWWIHRRHLRWIVSQGGYETHGFWYRVFFATSWWLPLLGLAEFAGQWWRPPTIWLMAGLLAVLVSLIVRFWTIRVRGPFWNIGRALIPGYHHRLNVGPYRWLARPDMAAWGLESCGLLLILGAPATLAANILILMLILFMATRASLTRFDDISISQVISKD